MGIKKYILTFIDMLNLALIVAAIVVIIILLMRVTRENMKSDTANSWRSPSKLRDESLTAALAGK